MDFSEAHEWRAFFPSGRQPQWSGRSQRHCRFVSPELDANLFPVDALLELSPERHPEVGASLGRQVPSIAEDAADVNADCGSAARFSEEDGTGRFLDSCFPRRPALGLDGLRAPSAGEPPPHPSVPFIRQRPAAAEPWNAIELGSGTAASSSAGATGRGGKEPLHPPVQPSRQDAGEKRPLTTSSALPFVRRLPEEYLRQESVESSLTVRLRQQSSNGSGERTGGHLAEVAGALFANFNEDEKVEVCVRLPPYESEDCAAVLVVPAAMRVADLRSEVLRKFADDAGLDTGQTYELRLYDEDEQEPDYDCPPFDEALQVGCLNVHDIALCAVSSPQSTPPSPPLSTVSEQAATNEPLATDCRTPKAPGGGILTKQGLLNWQGGAGGEASSGGVSVRVRAPPCEVPDELPCSATAGPQLGLAGSTPERAKAALPIATHAPCAPQTLANCLAPRPTRKASDPQKPHSKGDGSDAEAGGPLVYSHRRTRSSPNSFLDYSAPMVTVGGFEALPNQARTSSKVGASPAKHSSALATVEGIATGTQQLCILLPTGLPRPVSCNGLRELGKEVLPASDKSPEPVAASALCGSERGPEGGSGGEGSVLLNVRVDATLLEVLWQLSAETGRSYNSSKFAVERMQNGVGHRLDLDTRVRQLQAPLEALRVVRLDAPAALGPSTHLLGRGPEGKVLVTHQRPVFAFFFNEHTASIATEYFVTITMKGPRGARPADCALVVDRERLHHQAPRGPAVQEKTEQRRSSLLHTLKRIGRHLQLADTKMEASLFVERQVRDIQRIRPEESDKRVFSVVYGNAPGVAGGEAAGAELEYQAQTPTECAEIIARLNFLRQLVK